jgi:omega-6 fatty acid desaturase (delta-12 desaturase)
VWIGALVGAALHTDQSISLTVALGFVVPFVVWNAMIGFVVYVHHTHPLVRWYTDKKTWSEQAPFVSTTVHIEFPFRLGAWLHHIMEHTAHHVDMSVPLYQLKQAQQQLEYMLPERIVVQPFSWRWYFQTARQCKLYDFQAHTWTDFEGTPCARMESTPRAQS